MQDDDTPLGAEIIDALKAAGVGHVAALPDIVTSQGILWPLSEDPDIRLIRLCKEDEGVSICAGLSYCDTRAVLLMQQTGLMDSLNSIRATAVEYGLPVCMVVGMLGKEPDRPAAESENYGVRIVEPVLDAMGIDRVSIETSADVARLAPAIDRAYAESRPVVALIGRRIEPKDKIREVEHIIEELGEWRGTDEESGFQLVRTPEGRLLRIADLVDDEPTKRDRVAAALKDPTQKNNRDHVDIIIALGMAKEGFDWLWCEHALTVGYRASLTEVVQIIGRATRDAPGKTRARFTNLIAEPDASEEAVTEAVNDTLKAIAASLLMEQVLAPRFNFAPKTPANGPVDGVHYGQDGYDPDKCNVGFEESTGQFHIEIKGLVEPKSEQATRICQDDLNEVITAFVQDKTAIEHGLFDQETVPEELTQLRMGKIVKDKYPELDEEDQEAVRQHAIAALTLTQMAKKAAVESADSEPGTNTALIEGVRKFAMDVRELDIDLIDRINPFGEAYAILAKTMSEESLKQVAAVIAGKRVNLTHEEARELAKRAIRFRQERGRLPSLTSADAWERRMAEGVAFLQRVAAEAEND